MELSIRRFALAAMLVLVCAPTSWAVAQGKPERAQAAAAKEAPKPDPFADQEIGKRFSVTPEAMPAPGTGPVVSNAPLVLPYEGQTPRVLEGFSVTAFATGLENPRRLLVLPNGDVIVAEQMPGYLTLRRDADGDGRAEWIEWHAEGFEQPYGLAWRDDHILVADQQGIWRVPHKLGDVRAGHGRQRPIGEVPPDERKPSEQAYGQSLVTEKGVFGLAKGHRNRPLAIDPRSGALYVTTPWKRRRGSASG